MICCASKVINTDTSSSLFTKIIVGVSQSLSFLKDFFVGKTQSEVVTTPRNVTLALVGFGRTGTTSFTTALRKLGYAPIHDDQITEVADVLAAMMDGSMTMDEVNAEFGRRGFDAPMISTKAYVAWAAQAPDVKVILTVRDTKKWAQSWLKITPLAHLPSTKPFSWLKVMQDSDAYSRHFFFDILTQNQPELYRDIPTLEKGFEAWNEYVKSTVPSEKLLIFNVKQGWEPLCNFLGDTPIPEEPFPHINDGTTVTIIIYGMLIVTWIWPLFIVSPVFLVYLYCCRRTKEKKK